MTFGGVHGRSQTHQLAFMSNEPKPQPPSSSLAGNDIGRKAAHGVAWSFATYGLSKGLTLLTLAILARFLSKDAFGLVAVAVMVLNYLSILSELGLDAALIQRRHGFQEAANTVFTLTVGLGFILTVSALSSAPLIAVFFATPDLKPILQCLGLSFLINSLGSVHRSLLKRDLAFQKRMVADMGNALVKGLVSISLAVAGFGVWALVWGQLAGSLIAVLLVWWIYPWRPKLQVKRKQLKPLLGFGGPIVAQDTIVITTENMTAMLIGKFFGMALLGTYTMAYRLPEMLIIANLWLIGRVAFPAFSAIQNDPDQLQKGFLVSVRLVGMVVAPLSIGLFICAKPIVSVLFGPQWLDAVPLLRALTLYAWIYSIGFHDGGVYKAIGRPAILLKLAIISLLLTVLALIIGAHFGLIGIAVGHVVVITLRRAISLPIVAGFVHTSVWRILAELKPAIICGSLLALVSLICMFSCQQFPAYVQLLVTSTIGALTYGLSLWGLERNNLERVMELFQKDHSKQSIK